MELDELRNTWSALDKRLDKNSLLSDRIIKEMLHAKSNKSLGRLLGYEVFGMVVLLIVFPLVVYMWFKFHIRESNIGAVFIMFLFIVGIVGVIWQVVKIIILLKIDFSGNIKDNLLLTNKYNIFIRREKYAAIIMIPVFCLFGVCLYAEYNANAVLWTFLTCILLVTILFTIYQYKRIYDKNIKSILQSLEELKELEDE